VLNLKPSYKSQVQPNMDSLDLDLVVDWVKSQNYRVTRPFSPRQSYTDASPPANLLKVAILDTETTGINVADDKIIELGIVIVEYCPSTGQAYRVLETYNELEDPGMPIPPESTKVHGIVDTMVAGKKIMDALVEKLMEDVALVIAHNAAFDRGFVEARLPFFKKKAWGCSYAQIPWKGEGCSSASLEFLAYKFGFFFSGHRASMDCHALLEVLQSELPVSGVKVFKMLLDKTQAADLKLWALGAPFESKDNLKKRNYRWNAERKTWHKTIAAEDLDQEVNWLRADVYGDRPFKVEQEQMDAYNRFSNRRGVTDIISY
jgi:DNA polymerase-3 subunit epsilon